MEDTDWTFGGSWDIPEDIQKPLTDFKVNNYMVQMIEQVYILNASVTVVKGYVEIFLGDQLIIKMDCTSDYRCLFNPETTKEEVEFIMKCSDDFEMTIHNA